MKPIICDEAKAVLLRKLGGEKIYKKCLQNHICPECGGILGIKMKVDMKKYSTFTNNYCNICKKVFLLCDK